MILIDFSALIHQNVFGAVSGIHPDKDENGKYYTDQYIAYVKYLIIQSILNYKQKFSEYGNVVLCLDAHSGENWRLSVYKPYKGSRTERRAMTPINWSEVYEEIDGLIDAFNMYTPLSVIGVDHAEGDDIILCLVENCAKINEPVMIISADKDLLQAQKYPTVQQYSPTLKKFVFVTDKDETMEDWRRDHVYLGDASDEVPNVFKNLVFTPEFQKRVDAINKNITPRLLEEKPELIEKLSSAFGGDIFMNLKVGPYTLKKYFNNNSPILRNPLLLERVQRNEKLVLMEYIPESIRNDCKEHFKHVKEPKKYKKKEFEEYLTKAQCEKLIIQCNAFETGIIDDDFFE